MVGLVDVEGRAYVAARTPHHQVAPLWWGGVGWVVREEGIVTSCLAFFFFVIFWFERCILVGGFASLYFLFILKVHVFLEVFRFLSRSDSTFHI